MKQSKSTLKLKKGLSPKDLNKELAKRCGYYYYEIDDVLSCLFQYMEESFAKGIPVRLKNIGTLYSYSLPVREFTNLQTGEKYSQKPRLKVKFDITTTLLNNLNPDSIRVT